MTLVPLLGHLRPLLMLLGRWRQRLPGWMRRPGVIAVVLTPEGKVVLVRHSYMPGWFPPGGGRKRGESPRDAVIRELREEIGLTGWSAMSALPPDDAGLAIFVIHDATYRFRPSLEIVEAAAVPRDQLPANTSPRLAKLLAAGLPQPPAPPNA